MQFQVLQIPTTPSPHTIQYSPSLTSALRERLEERLKRSRADVGLGNGKPKLYVEIHNPTGLHVRKSSVINILLFLADNKSLYQRSRAV